MAEQLSDLTEMSVDQKLAEIATAPVRYAWWRDRHLPGIRLHAELPHGCLYAASSYTTKACSSYYKQLSTSSFYVPQELRGYGIGTRLMKASLTIAKQRGVVQSAAAIENPASLHIRRLIFGEENMVNTYYGSPERLSVDEAIGFLVAQRSIGLEEGPDIISVSRLEPLDITGWEIPMRIGPQDLQPRVVLDELS